MGWIRGRLNHSLASEATAAHLRAIEEGDGDEGLGDPCRIDMGNMRKTKAELLS